MNIYEITGAYLKLQALLEEGGSDPDVVKDTLEAMEGELEEKADNYARIMKNFEGDIEALKKEEARLKSKRESLEKSITLLKTRLYEAMKATGKTKFKTELFSFGIQKNGGALPVVVDVDTSELPDEFVIVTEKPDLKRIGDYLKNTVNCDFAHFGERGESLRIN